MRRRDLLIALAATPATLMLPSPATAQPRLRMTLDPSREWTGFGDDGRLLRHQFVRVEGSGYPGWEARSVRRQGGEPGATAWLHLEERPGIGLYVNPKFRIEDPHPITLNEMIGSHCKWARENGGRVSWVTFEHEGEQRHVVAGLPPDVDILDLPVEILREAGEIETVVFVERPPVPGETGVAVSTVPFMRTLRPGDEGRLIMHAIPRGEVPIKEVTYSIYEGEVEDSPVLLIGPERRLPVNPAPGEYHAVVAVPRGARRGGYFVHWRIMMEDGSVTVADHPFWVTRPLTRLHVTY